MKLYTHPFSSNARKVRMVAHELELPLDLEFVDLAKGAQRRPEFLALNPSGAVPVLVDGDFVLPESHAILLYLCERSAPASHTLYPRELTQRAQVHRWLFWMSNHWSPAIAGLNFEHNLKRLFGQGDADPAQVARHERFFRQFAGVLDGQLATRAHAAGEALSLADFALASPLMYADAAHLPLADFAHLSAWFERLRGRASWKATEPTA